MAERNVEHTLPIKHILVGSKAREGEKMWLEARSQNKPEKPFEYGLQRLHLYEI